MNSASRRTTASDPTPRPRRGAILAVASAVLVVTAVVLWPTRSCGFTNWDDPTYVVQNRTIQTLDGASIGRMFGSEVLGNYHPLTMLSYAMDFAIGGLDPATYHTTNLLLHLVNTALVFALLLALTGHPAVATIVSLLFGIHPMHVESVAWIAERKDLLYTAFFLGAMVAHVRWVRTGRWRWFAAVGALFVLSLLSKAMAVTLPVVLVAVDLFLRRPVGRRMVLEKLPLFVVSIAFGLVALNAQASSGAIVETHTLGLPQRVVVAGWALLVYVGKLLVPVRLACFYPYPPGIEAALPTHMVVLAAASVVLFAAALLSWRRAPVVAFGAAFFLVTVALVLQVIPVGGAILADRYSYVPSIGLFLVLASGGVALVRWRPALRTPLLAVVAVYAGWLGWAANQRCHDWRDAGALWSSAIAVHPSAVAHNQYGTWLAERGRVADALPQFDRAITLDPRNARAFVNRGNALSVAGDRERAIADFDRALALRPTLVDAWTNRGITYQELGRDAQALADFAEALRLRPDDPVALRARAYTHLGAGDLDAAFAAARAFVAVAPGDFHGPWILGEVRRRQGRARDALRHYEDALARNRGFAPAWFARAEVLAALGRTADARTSAIHAARLGYPLPDGFLDRLR